MEVKKIGFLQALEVILYCSLIGFIFLLGPKISPHVNPYFGPVTFLLLFSVSALICGLIVFYKPYQLFFAGKKKEAIDIVFFTTLGLFLSLPVLFLLMILFK